MAITVSELVGVPFLSMRFHAGAGGGGRLVTWAHTSDLPNPIEWLAPGELLMSNGLNVPDEALGQVAFLAELASAGLSGLAVGDDMHAPPLAPAFLERANELDFPLLAIPRDVPFVAVSRAVANANSDEEHKRLVQTVQLYEALRGAVSTGRSGAALLRELGGQLDCRLLLLDAATALPVVGAQPEPPAGLAERLVADLRGRRGVFPAVLRVDCNGTSAFALRVPTKRPTALVALHEDERLPDLALLQHAANIAALEVERINAEREHEMRLGSELLAAMLERRIEPASAAQQLGEHGIEAERAVLVVFRPTVSVVKHRNLHHDLAQREVPHVVLWTPSAASLFCPTQRKPSQRFVVPWAPAWRSGSAIPYAARTAHPMRVGRPAGPRLRRILLLSHSCATGTPHRCSCRAPSARPSVRRNAYSVRSWPTTRLTPPSCCTR